VISLAVAWIQSVVSGLEFKGSTNGWIDDGVGTVRNRFGLRIEIPGVKCGGNVACGLPAVTRTGVVLVLRRRVGGSFLRGGFGAAAATSLLVRFW
jgi:hypothetical protein